LLERMVYTGIDLVARCLPPADDEGRAAEPLLDRLLDAPA
jgi:hypothetical protein